MAHVTNTIYWIDDFTDEVVPCDCTLQGWADWLSQPDEDWGRLEACASGTIFSAERLVLYEDITCTKNADVWETSDDMPEGANFFAPRHGPGLGWVGEEVVDTVADLDLEGSDAADIACGTRGSRVRIRYDLTPDGPRCEVHGSIQ